STPGVVAVSPLVAEPFTGANTFTVALEAEGTPSAAGAITPIVSYDAVGPDFFRAMGLPLRRGTSFTDADGSDTPLVAVLTESIAARLWPGQDPIGRRFRFLGDTGSARWRTVVGVAGELHYREYPSATPTVFVHYKQLAFWQGAVVVRTKGDPSNANRAIRDALRAAVPEMPVWQALPMNALIEAPLARPRFNAAFLAAFGL